MAHIIKLNVGGSLFQTSKSTLTKFDGFFKTMLETEIPVAKDESGAIFIDRDPKHFRVILNFMRGGHVDLQKYSEDVTEIQKEAKYYLLGGLVELCKLKPEAQKMPYFAETFEDMARTVASSTKKVIFENFLLFKIFLIQVVCTVFFGTAFRCVYRKCFIKAVMLYGDKVDFCFREQAVESTRIIIHKKMTNRVFDENPGFVFDFDIIKKRIPDIDNY
ncbi:Protein CBG24423 [Caenorhabditis briggsae]|uniref:Protein CBG24423 n=1 Tax=Caenorhabditis briggsae TaxID=6238 RepID=A8WKP2_CAEBR|nr:Protein CBG24423 [Caenorhabditis briggsae]CAP21037.2 Protein CBG24423 [Caenorhabditis briggsae]